MQATAHRKYAEALAHDIASVLNAAPDAAGRVKVVFDHDADTHCVQVTTNRIRYELTMPAQGAIYGLFRRGRWIGGMGLTSDANPVDVASRLLDRIKQTI